MPRLVAFLRAINVGGHTVTMAVLRRRFEQLGVTDVATFIASGNVVFRSRARDRAALTRRIEKHLRTELGYEVATFLRSDAEIASIAAYRPFPESRIRAAGAFVVGFLAEPLDAAAQRTLTTFRTDIDDFHVHGRELYWLCVTQQSESTFSNVKLEKALTLRATFRGMNTIVRLAAKYPPA